MSLLFKTRHSCLILLWRHRRTVTVTVCYFKVGAVGVSSGSCCGQLLLYLHRQSSSEQQRTPSIISDNLSPHSAFHASATHCPLLLLHALLLAQQLLASEAIGMLSTRVNVSVTLNAAGAAGCSNRANSVRFAAHNWSVHMYIGVVAATSS